ncbi:DUF4843 domain-containing protein [Sphingobacterium griseoflavum]|uniref:DUF4843 domain-containing protein n=1 Tax=Sphingobacterium griseoflavum TaxID=1474952 RepID=A0ABQ3I0J9_9SPHI|nr:DUF4843 domain-containing protein [Sphingobacterium griseoflavum]GHE44526.1 hypothetical protein GCM10017764_29680 [Sphingobacterium griseoflavum]
MKEINYLVAVLSMLMYVSCKNAEEVTYDRHANVYFNMSANERDSVVYTFAYDMTKATDTIFIPVQIVGHRVPSLRHYAAYVELDSSSAEQHVHFDALEDAYPLAANTGTDSLPIIVHNLADLEDRSVSLIVKLMASADFGIENPRLIRAKIVLSARLEQPLWWSMWLGGYSRVKHQLFLLVTEQRTLTMEGLDAPKNLYYANLLNMMLNDPFKWVADNLDKGYVLHTTDNGASYAFYHNENPNRALLLRKNVSADKYYFIDEDGREVR